MTPEKQGGKGLESQHYIDPEQPGSSGLCILVKMTSDGVILWTALSSLVGYSPFGLETLTGDKYVPTS